MDSLARILLPVDFSERSVAAAHCARALVPHFGSELILLHVRVPPQCEFGTADIAGSMLAELCLDRSVRAKSELDSFLAADLDSSRVRRVVLEGDPATTIVEFAHSQRCDLIVMPTHGYGPFRRFILGSNTAKVLHDADCPVWTLAHMEQAPAAISTPFRRILCAVDLGPQSAQALCWAARLAREFGTQLTLFHATACDPALRSAAGDELARLRSSVAAEAELEMESGEPSRLICAAAPRVQADVLV